MAETLKQEAKRLLTNVPEEYVFWCSDGRVLRSMQELGEALTTMSEETFAFHANAQRNDFSNWVRDIIKDEKLAKDLAQSLSRTQAARVVGQRFTLLKGKSK